MTYWQQQPVHYYQLQMHLHYYSGCVFSATKTGAMPMRMVEADSDYHHHDLDGSWGAPDYVGFGPGRAIRRQERAGLKTDDGRS